jgi:predicted nuclease with TOPRIM domain
VVHLTDEVATLQSVKSKSGMQKLVSEAGLGGMRVTDKLKNALKALAVARSDLMKITAEKAGIGEELKNLAQERDMLQEKLHNLSPKLDSLFLREKELLADLESESNARKRLAAAADEQKIVIVDLQKQLVQVMNKVGLMQRTRAKAGKADDTQAY